MDTNYISKIAKTSARVIITGETGTGKSRLAAQIHAQSARAAGPMVVIDCTALAGGLAESQLFGHVKGAFSGAVTDHAGFFEQAHGGTVFIDEVGELPLDLQPKLLRALQDGVVRRLGSKRDTTFDVRVICATHRDLRGMVEAGKFREDLYYRLAGLTVRMPALRERRSEIPAILASARGLREGVAEALASAPYDWPGNVRELLAVAGFAGELGLSAAEVLWEVCGDGDQTRVGKVAPPPAGAGVSPRAEAATLLSRVVALAQRPQGVTTAEVQAASRVGSASAASRILRKMVARGFLRRRSNGVYSFQG
jgi:MoxR-like ATPase